LEGKSLLPWKEKGYECWSYHPDHQGEGETSQGIRTCHIKTQDWSWKNIPDDYRIGSGGSYLTEFNELFEKHYGKVAFTAIFPPHANLSYMGSQWWGKKALTNPDFQEESISLAMTLRTLAQEWGSPYYIENPAGVLSRSDYLGLECLIMEPYDYGGYLDDTDYALYGNEEVLPKGDWYRRRRWIWTGNELKLPEKRATDWKGDIQSVMTNKRKDKRILQDYPPRGFNKAICEVNHG
jgi:hypothetical protein